MAQNESGGGSNGGDCQGFSITFYSDDCSAHFFTHYWCEQRTHLSMVCYIGCIEVHGWCDGSITAVDCTTINHCD